LHENSVPERGAVAMIGQPRETTGMRDEEETTRSTRRTVVFLLLCLLCFLWFLPISIFAQTRLEFEVASIRPASEQVQPQVAAGLHVDGAQVALNYFSVKDIVGMAYRVKPNQIIGPDWLSGQRYTIAAKLPDGASQDQVPQMLQSLLTDRFQMKTHRETREFPVYALGVAKTGLKISALPADPDTQDKAPINIAAGGNGNGVAINLGNGSSFALGPTAFEVKKLDMPTFADMLTRFTDRPVVDMTEIKGRYDFSLDLTPEDRTAMLIRIALAQGVVLPPQAMRALDFGSNVSLSSSLEKLGFTLESRRAPLEILIIDSIQKTPTEN
jgi:uncharacterized protein (TIGR03435 family)